MPRARNAPERLRRTAGLTLIELVISIAVIGIALTGTLLGIHRTIAHSADPMIQQQAAAIAEAYLEEALAKPYLDPDTGTVCPAAEPSRDLYDNTCDYGGLDDSGAQSQDGSPVAGLEAYRVRVTVDTAANLNGLTGSAQVLRVDVRVTRGNRVDVTLSGYRANY